MSEATYDVFLDLSGESVDLDGLGHVVAIVKDRLGEPQSRGRFTAGSATAGVLVVGDRSFPIPESRLPLEYALDLAHLEGRGLFVITGRWSPDVGLLDAIAALASLDPNIGSIQPRFLVGDPAEVVVVRAAPATISRSVVELLPPYYVTPELESPCVYITPQAVPACSFLPRDMRPDNLIGVLLMLRRKGLRNLVSNRHLVDFPLGPVLAYPVRQLPGQDAAAFDYAQGGEWWARAPFMSLEKLLGGAVRNGRRRLLLDCRGMTPAHNGSAHAILGYLTGIAQLTVADWDITVCVGRDAARFHHLDARFPDFNYSYDRPGETYLVALHLTQPWTMEMVADLHDTAPLIAFNILDTIAWDAIYPAPTDLDEVTRFAAAWADGLTYLSEHSRDRFRFRFTPHHRLREAITYLSTAPQDYAPFAPVAARREIGLLVVGNPLDHKDLDRTAMKLAEAFPFTRIVAFGTEGRSLAYANVAAIPAGFLDEASVRDLYERASVLIYPSFSEGFGIPVVQALSLGKPVVARALPLWAEMRRKTGADGRLLDFHTDAELVEAVGQALALGQAPPRTVAASATTWAECGQVLLDFAEELVHGFSFDHWQERDLALGPP